ncbi:MAG: hypothetical protein IPI92_20330 [Gemmatimonadetes bacterium]|nr:hypothetical protein [Gemmatimonadota bacterium]
MRGRPWHDCENNYDYQNHGGQPSRRYVACCRLVLRSNGAPNLRGCKSRVSERVGHRPPFPLRAIGAHAGTPVLLARSKRFAETIRSFSSLIVFVAAQSMSPRRAISARMASSRAIPCWCRLLEALCLFGKLRILGKQPVNVIRRFRRALFGAVPGYVIHGQSSIFWLRLPVLSVSESPTLSAAR